MGKRSKHTPHAESHPAWGITLILGEIAQRLDREQPNDPTGTRREALVHDRSPSPRSTTK